MVAPGLATAASLAAVRAAIRPGVTTLELDAIAEKAIRDLGGVPNFMKEPGYRHTICTSVNDDVVHGIPGARVIEAGDIVSIDSGAELGGWNGDAAFSLVVPDASRPELVGQRQRLADDTEQSLWRGIAALATASHLNQGWRGDRGLPRFAGGNTAFSRITSATASDVRCTRNRPCSITASATAELR